MNFTVEVHHHTKRRMTVNNRTEALGWTDLVVT
jgi:hypothetical protein